MADSGSDGPGSLGVQHQELPLQEVLQSEVPPPEVQPAPVRQNAPIEPIRAMLPQVAQEHGYPLFTLAQAQNGLDNRSLSCDIIGCPWLPENGRTLSFITDQLKMLLCQADIVCRRRCKQIK